MSRQEWEELAEAHEEKAAQAHEDGDEVLHELYWHKAQSARFAAAYGTEPEDKEKSCQRLNAT